MIISAAVTSHPQLIIIISTNACAMKTMKLSWWTVIHLPAVSNFVGPPEVEKVETAGYVISQENVVTRTPWSTCGWSTTTAGKRWHNTSRIHYTSILRSTVTYYLPVPCTPVVCLFYVSILHVPVRTAKKISIPRNSLSNSELNSEEIIRATALRVSIGLHRNHYQYFSYFLSIIKIELVQQQGRREFINSRPCFPPHFVSPSDNVISLHVRVQRSVNRSLVSLNPREHWYTGRCKGDIEPFHRSTAIEVDKSRAKTRTRGEKARFEWILDPPFTPPFRYDILNTCQPYIAPSSACTLSIHPPSTR